MTTIIRKYPKITSNEDAATLWWRERVHTHNQKRLSDPPLIKYSGTRYRSLTLPEVQEYIKDLETKLNEVYINNEYVHQRR